MLFSTYYSQNYAGIIDACLSLSAVLSPQVSPRALQQLYLLTISTVVTVILWSAFSFLHNMFTVLIDQISPKVWKACASVL